MKSFLYRTSLLIAICFSLFNLQIVAQQSKYNEEISEDLQRIGQEKLELIKNDFSASASNEWEGTYFSVFGVTVSNELTWSEKSGYFTKWFNCSKPWTERINYGAAELSNGRLKIYPTLSEKDKSSHITPVEYLSLKWDEQHFLIPPDELINFAYAIHSNSESQIGSFLVKSGDERKSRKGFPTLPKEFERFLTMKAIQPKITAIKKSKNNSIWEYEITLNVGSIDNVINGMTFYSSSPNGEMKLLITDLQSHTSKARVIGIASEEEPRIGMNFTSKKPEHIFED